MGIQDLQKFIETQCPNACVPVDLLKIARAVAVRKKGKNATNNRLCLVVDGECCLDRLYGGYFSDWVCGGQWNRMVQFLAVLIQTIQSNNIELAVFFNGGLEVQKMNQWVKLQAIERRKINQVLKHVLNKATPPPKIWWTAPVCLTTCLRMALRHLNVTVVCTMDDHHQEVIAYCRENNFHGILAEDAEYVIFDPPRLFSSEQLKLTYKGSLETKEYILDEVAKALDLHPNRFCVFAALLGNYLLTEEDLLEFYRTLIQESPDKATPEAVIRAVVNFVRGLQSIDNLDAIGENVFRFSTTQAEKIQKFKHCVQYYLNGTNDGFLRYRPTMQVKKHEPGHYQPIRQAHDSSSQHTNDTTTAVSPPANAAQFASEAQDDDELSSINAYTQATSGYGSHGQSSNMPQIVIDPPSQSQTDRSQNLASKIQSQLEKSLEKFDDDSAADEDGEADGQTGGDVQSSNLHSAESPSPKHQVNGLLLSSSTSSSSSSSSPNRLSPDAAWAMTMQQKIQPKPQQGNSNHNKKDLLSRQQLTVPPEVMRTASERHQKGLMSPWIYQILTQREIKIPVMVEEENFKELPSGAFMYRPIRQQVYAILFNLHHLNFLNKQKQDKDKQDGQTSKEIAQNGDTSPVEIVVKEWMWSKKNPYRSPDLIKAQPLNWRVPTVQRLWFGSSLDDKKRRLRAFLTCMNSDTTLMLNTSYVPQHLLVMCCVLRYIVTYPERRVLRKQELDAFLAQSVSPQLMDAQAMQDMQLPVISPRGIQLAALFMRGVEAALMANDACGAPIPWLMCCPWLFFDGKLFHHKLLKANSAKTLIEICDGQIDQVAKVERMRQAILEGLTLEFARAPLPAAPPPPPGCRPGYHPSANFLPAGHPLMPPGRGLPRGRGLLGRRPVLSRGGQLEIAGVVVGSWGANLSNKGRGMHVAPRVTAVGGLRRGDIFRGMPRGRGYPGRGQPRKIPSWPGPAYDTRQINAYSFGANKRRLPRVKRGIKRVPISTKSFSQTTQRMRPSSASRGRGCTVETNDSVVEVSKLIKEDITSKNTAIKNDGRFDDAEGEKKNSETADTKAKSITNREDINGSGDSEIKSPDSGVHVDINNASLKQEQD